MDIIRTNARKIAVKVEQQLRAVNYYNVYEQQALAQLKGILNDIIDGRIENKVGVFYDLCRNIQYQMKKTQTIDIRKEEMHWLFTLSLNNVISKLEAIEKSNFNSRLQSCRQNSQETQTIEIPKAHALSI